MARRKGVTASTNKNKPISVALHSVQFPPDQDDVQSVSKNINIYMDSENTQIPVSSQEKTQFEFTFNNNDHKYLHKKFKKMASATTHLSEETGQMQILQSTSQNSTTIKVPSPLRTDLQPNKIVSYNSNIKYPNVLIDRELENNVQIKFKNATDETSDNFGLNLVSECNEANSRDNKISEKTDHIEVDTHYPKETVNGAGNGRYVCPYCKLSCAKPSVLQKHIRAHTNERPYPCTPCGFAFKTKSNLYKHCRSRAHSLRLQGNDAVPSANEEDWSLGSESDVSVSATSLSENSLKVDNWSINENSSSDIYQNDRVSPSTTHSNSISQTEFKPKTIYKPKFHKASLYQENDGTVKSNLSSNSDFLNQHISKIISDNEAVVDTLDSPLHKKFNKLSNIQKQLGENVGRSSINEVKELQQPLNLTKDILENDLNIRKRCYSESFVQQDLQKAPQHPLNPEGSIIKDLLLKARAQATGLLPVTSEDYDGTETLYVCPVCQISYRSADNLEIHRLYYCKGNLINRPGTVSPISRDLTKLCKTENILRSNSVHVTLPETYNPNTLAKLATSTLKTPTSKTVKPEELVLQHDCNDTTTPLPSPGPLLGNTRLVDTKYSLGNTKQSTLRLLEGNRSRFNRSGYDDPPSGTMDSAHKNDDILQRSELYSPPMKMRCLENNPTTLRSLEELSLSPMRQNSSSLQMFGGEVMILDNSGATTTLRIEPTRSQLSPSLIPQSVSSPKLQTQSESSNIVRSGLQSGGTMVHNLPTPKEMPSPMPQTPRMKVSIAPNISTPNLAIAGIPVPNMTHFQFPPLGSITAYNPLTLPPLSPVPSPNGALTILHGGKFIPYVPGMPGPNTPTSYLPIGQKFSLKYPTASEAVATDLLIKNDNINKHIQGPTVLTEIGLAKMQSEGHGNTRTTNSRRNLRSPEKQMHQSIVLEKSTINSGDNQANNVIASPERHKFLSIPSIIINSGDNVKIKNGITTQSVKQAQIKIDELLKKNSEIVHPTNQMETIPQEIKMTSNNLTESDKLFPKTQQKEIRHFNFENLISKSEIVNKSVINRQAVTSIDRTSPSLKPERSETSYFKKIASSTAVGITDVKTKFLRPSSLPLKPGTFVPKKHHGITPNANTLPLISPETPRPAKAYGQLHLNGHAYTYLGLKCSTKVYFCTLNRPQPTYVPNQHSLSMYSNWQVCSEATPHPLGLTPCKAMALYDSRHRPQSTSVASIKRDQKITHSSQWKKNQEKKEEESDEGNEQKSDFINKNKDLTGGFESNEEYIYVRGRGRGRYVCSECGIRCKKPSMLKKHIRTHTDVRPYTCKHCAFSFKTKGNLTKHMKSKSHYQKCRDLGISPLEEIEANEATHGSGETDEGSDSDGDDGNEGETESSDTDSWKSRLPEHEAAQSLLSLWDGGTSNSVTPGSLTSARPTTYPYAPQQLEDSVLQNTTISVMIPSMESIESFKEGPSIIEHDEPMDLSKYDTRMQLVAEIMPSSVREHSVIASLALSAAKFPQTGDHWASGEPMLHAYLTEKALRDAKIKQSQYTFNKLRQLENQTEKVSIILDKREDGDSETRLSNQNNSINEQELLFSRAELIQSDMPNLEIKYSEAAEQTQLTCTPIAQSDNIALSQSTSLLNSQTMTSQAFTSTQVSLLSESRGNENAKFVASEYLKMTSVKSNGSHDKQYHVTSDGSVERNDDNGSNKRSIRETMDKNEIEKSKLPDHLGVARKVVVGAGGVSFKVASASAEFTTTPNFSTGRINEDGRSVCVACNKSFSKPSQLRLHINIHYMERPFRCSACAVSFRTRGHLQKHERSGSHHNKVSMTSTFGAATSANPRPFKCPDCKIAFRIHGHLAKHLRSKMHVMKLECLGKLPFGTFAEIERAGVSLTDIDTTDCDNSLASLQILAQKLHEKDPTKLESWDPATMVPPLLPAGRESSDEEDSFSSDNKCEVNENRNVYRRTENGDLFQTNYVKTQFSATDT